MDDNTEWHSIPCADSYYKISKEGRVKNNKTGKIIRGSLTPWLSVCMPTL